MERYSEMIGLPVVSVEDGSKLGTVKDMIFSPGNREVAALLLEPSGVSQSRKIIRVQDVLNMGRDAVTVSGRDQIKSLRSQKDLSTLYKHGRVKGLRVYSKTGSDLGVVEDVLFDCTTGDIEGVEISDGILQDILHGRRILPLFGKVEFGEEFIVVDREATEEITSTGGGLKHRLLGENDHET